MVTGWFDDLLYWFGAFWWSIVLCVASFMVFCVA